MDARPDSNPELARSLVLVVEDDAAVERSLRFTLELEGYRVESFGDAEDLLESGPPPHACLVIDYRLPGLNGLQAIQELRRRGMRVPAVLITSAPTLSVARHAASAGVMIVEKPLLTNTLLRTVQDAIQTSPRTP